MQTGYVAQVAVAGLFEFAVLAEIAVIDELAEFVAFDAVRFVELVVVFAANL
ncbi:MAG: hypothetical protein ACRC4N_16955 [Gammaproteobacteria bacterium]